MSLTTGPAVSGTSSDLSQLERLPEDVASQLFSDLSLPDLLVLQRTSKALYSQISHAGIPTYLAAYPQAHLTISPPQIRWPPYDLIRRNYLIETAFHRRQWQALQIGQTWSQPVIPVLNVLEDRILLGVGGKLVIHPLLDPDSGHMPHHTQHTHMRGQGRGKSVARAYEYPIARKGTGSGTDIVGLVPQADGSLVVGQFDGTVQRFVFPPSGPRHAFPTSPARYPHAMPPGQPRSVAHFAHPRGTNMHTLCGSESGDLLLTITSASIVSSFRTRSPWIPPETFALNAARAWSSKLYTAQPSLAPTAFLGVHGSINLHPVLPTGIVSTSSSRLTGPDLPLRSSPYGLVLPPSPSVHHPSTLLSAWYDSHLRLHDLRAPPSAPSLVLTAEKELFDPVMWSDSAGLYSCAFFGTYGVAGGGAMHGTVALFDVRMPKKGWSVFSPGGKGSPVYSLQGEGGRLWGVSERRAFVLALDGAADSAGGQKWDGLVLPEARAAPEQMKERARGYGRRGGKWSWTVRQGGPDVIQGYEHATKAGQIQLLDGLEV